MRARWNEENDPQYLESILHEIFKTRSVVTDIQWKRSEYSSSSAAYNVNLQLANGEDLRLFLKDYGTFLRVREEMAERRLRESYVYQSVLPDANLGTAIFYGSVWDEIREQYWICLEFVRDSGLARCQKQFLDITARWLGRLQGYFMPKVDDLLSSCEVLVRYDRNHLRSTAELALRTAFQISSDFGNRLLPIMDQYEKVVEAMVSQPETFVHGSYRPNHILTDESCRPIRICPIDWEMAGIGSSLLDLSYLAYKAKSKYLDLIFNAYRSEAVRYGIPVCDNGQMKYIVDCYRLHKVMNWLSKSLSSSYPEKLIIKLVDMAEMEWNLIRN